MLTAIADALLRGSRRVRFRPAPRARAQRLRRHFALVGTW